jgi:hypothetical protein
MVGETGRTTTHPGATLRGSSFHCGMKLVILIKTVPILLHFSPVRGISI